MPTTLNLQPGMVKPLELPTSTISQPQQAPQPQQTAPAPQAFSNVMSGIKQAEIPQAPQQSGIAKTMIGLSDSFAQSLDAGVQARRKATEEQQALGPQQAGSPQQTPMGTVDSIAAAIRQVESGGNYGIKGGSGEIGAYQFMPNTWKDWAGKFLDNPNAQMTPENQDTVAKAKINELINQGYNPEQIALIWNGGEPVRKAGTNKFGVKYDSGAYADKVLGALQLLQKATQDQQTPNQKYPNLKGSSLANLGTQTTPYGGSTRIEKFHPAVDIANKIGTPIPAFAGGTVTAVIEGKKQDMKGAYGNYVIVTDADGNQHRYSHLSGDYVQVGQKVKPGQVIGKMGNCFDDKTEILTDNGWKLFKDLTEDDLVYTANLKSHKIEKQKPTAYIEKVYDKMFTYGDKRDVLDFSVSHDHRMMIKLHQDQAIKMTPLEEINAKKVYVPLKAFHVVGKEEKYYKIEEREYIRDRWGTKAKMPEQIIPMDTWLSFLGFWLSDGWLIDTNKTPKRLGVTQSFKNGNKRSFIRKILDLLPFHFGEAREDYVCNSQHLFYHLREWGKKGNKTIPRFIFDLSPRQIRIFLNAYFLGDGWYHKGTRYIVFGQKNLADDYQALLAMVGSHGVIREYDPSKINRKNPPMIGDQEVKAKNKFYVLTELKASHSTINKMKLKEIDYGRNAYCVTVGNGTLFVRRNGKAMWCGNSGAAYSNSGGTGSHLDYRIKSAAGKYLNPNQFLGSFYK